MALRKARAVNLVVGFGRSELPLAQSLQLGVIEPIGKDIAVERQGRRSGFAGDAVGQMSETDEAHRAPPWRKDPGL